MKIDVYQVPKGEHRAGYWTFTVDGKPSLFYSTIEQGIWDKIAELKGQKKPGAVALVPLKGTGKKQGDKDIVVETPQPITMDQFMQRGKLGKPLTESKDKK